MRRMLVAPMLAVLGPLVAVLGMLGMAAAGPAGAQTSTSQIASQLSSTGRYLEPQSTSAIDAAIASANAKGVAFAWLSGTDDAEATARSLSTAMGSSSSYRTVLVLTQAGVGARSQTLTSNAVQQAVDAGFTSFRDGAVADGINAFVARLNGQTTATTASAGSTSGSSSSSSSSSGGGSGGTILAVILVIIVAGLGFLVVHSLRTRRKVKRAAAAELEKDRAEIKEQLKNNADSVLSLGDKVIASKDAELQTAYEQASAAYQDVSQSVDAATTAQEVDALDDKIDQAEWQFKMIEARLDGQPVPPSPAELQAQAAQTASRQPPGPGRPGAPPPPGAPTPGAPAPSHDGPALGPNDSVFGGRNSYPDPDHQPVPSRRGGFGMGGGGTGGGMGGGLGSILGSIILGGIARGGLGGMTSRRSQQRRDGGGGDIFGGSMGSMGGGGLGGGVLNRGGESDGGGSGGRSFGDGGGSGGRTFGS